jgi:hypothetical protein
MMIAPVIFALLLGVFIFAILPHAGLVRRTSRSASSWR